MNPPPPVTRLGAQHAAKHELSKSIYHRGGDPLLVRAVRAVGRLIDHVLDRASIGGLSGSAGVIAILVLIIVITVVVVWRVGPPRRAAAAGAVLSAGPPASAAGHRALSERAADAADWHTAVVERMRAIARELEERGVLEPRRGRTASELTSEAGQRLPDAAVELRSAAATFNAIAYGGRTAAAADLEVLATADRAIRRSASARRPVLASS
jgi:Domain of unknown function (DUF4129)